MTLTSELTCPHCLARRVEVMSTDACQYFYECSGCGTMLKPKHGDCCVFCSYGSVPCPPIQAARSANDLPSPTERCPVEPSHPQVHARAAILLVQAVVLALLEKGALDAEDMLGALSDVVEAYGPAVDDESSDGAAAVVREMAQAMKALQPGTFGGCAPGTCGDQ